MQHTLTVHGMTCGHCEKAVTQAIKALDPNAEVTIQRQTGTVLVTTTQDRAAIANAIADEGYRVQA